MKTLDRYIVRQFLINYLVVVAVLFALFVLVDTILDLDEFMRAGKILQERHGGVAMVWSLWVVLDWYVPLGMLAYAYFSGLFAVAAMGFTFATLSRSRELLAMVASGISLYRVCAPVLIVGCVLSVMSLPLQELVIPRLAHKLSRSKADVGRQRVSANSLYFLPDDAGNLISAARYEGDTQTLYGVTILRRDEDGRVIRRISGDTATWDEHRLGWVVAQSGHSADDDSISNANHAPNAPDASPPVFFPTEMAPRRLMARRASFFPLLLSLSQLQQMASIAPEGAAEASQFRQIMNSRFSLMVLNVLIMVMGMPFFLSTNPDNMLLLAVKAASLCLGAWGCGLMMVMTGVGLFNPVTAAWIPVVIYLPIAAGMLMAVKT